MTVVKADRGEHGSESATGPARCPEFPWDGWGAGPGAVTRPAYSDVVMSSVQQALPGTAALQRSTPGTVGRDLAEETATASPFPTEIEEVVAMDDERQLVWRAKA